ncbi:tyrosine-type recombinase/integrase [Ilumatobacter fluminis]|uniref:tyrosine-type recombinase/integrase n=1 Tax=Ilumatobacter fluminis TaxID=467091 RepID=UPI00105C808A|nr:tyrosine-type recombinase/integrase [Ilumatobacter fluminis]
MTFPKASYTADEVAQMHGVSASLIRKMVARGELARAPGFRHAVRIPHTELVAKFGPLPSLAHKVAGTTIAGDDTPLIVTEPDGSPIHPQVLTRRFHAATKAAEVPAIRLHDVRHSYTTAPLKSGVPVKVLSQRLGHADIAITLRVYSDVLDGDDEATADLAASFIGGTR